MNRKGTREGYLSLLKKLREKIPDIAVRSTFISGFPTETEEDFLQSMAIVKEAGFSQIHAFPYSPREGTNAYKRYKELPASVKKERVERLIAKGAQEKEKYMRRFIGQTLEIVPENCFDGITEGYSENYIRVYVEGDIGKDPTQVRVERLFKDGVLASCLTKS